MKLFRNLIVFFLAYSLACSFNPGVLFNRVINLNNFIHARKSLEEIMDKQESVFGIKFSEKPTVRFHLPEDYSSIQRSLIPGVYDFNEDVLYIDLKKTFTSGDGFIDKFSRKVRQEFSNMGFIDEILAHELGHVYVDQRCDSLDIPSCYSYRYNKKFAEGFRFINEGIAEYFKKSIFPESELDYIEEYGFVAPILNKYGKPGIDFLILNPPKSKDIENKKSLEKYRRSFE